MSGGNRVVESGDEGGVVTVSHKSVVPSDLLSTEDIETSFVERILREAASFEEVLARPVPVVPVLRGVTVAVAFFEPSTRTRISFELAARRLSADVISFAAAGSAVSKGESLIDTALTLTAIGADCLVIRHPCSGAPERIAEVLDVPVVNAGDGCHQHPTQALTDLYTIRKRWGGNERLRVTIVGDIQHSRVARSAVWLFSRFGFEVTCVGPPALLPRYAEGWPCAFSHSLDDVIPNTDVLMLLRLQLERGAGGAIGSEEEYRQFFGVDLARAKALPEGAVIMHPGPVNRGVEVDPDVLALDNCLVNEQVASGLAVRMAVLYLLTVGSREEPADARI
ncbi:MAG: aspartate carbamoyltransferase [Acidimicrobiia bacterium]